MWIFFGVTANFDNFHGLFLKSITVFLFCGEIYPNAHHNCH